MTKKKLDKYGNDLEQECMSDIYIFFPLSDLIMEPMHKMGLTPNQITIMSTLLTITSTCLYYNGLYNKATISYLLGYLMDSLDGRMARNYNQGSLLGMMLDSTSDVITNIPIIVIFFIKTMKAIKYGIHVKRSVFLFVLFLVFTFIFGIVFGINEAIDSFDKTKDDNFYKYKKELLLKENIEPTHLSNVYLYITEQTYKTYRRNFPDKITNKTIKDMRKKLFNLKEFGPGNYNIFIAILMYLF